MDRPMMGPAEQGQVGQIGGATIEPVHQMMGFAPGQGAVTVGEDTAAVPHGQGNPLGGLDDPAGPPHIQRLAGRSAQHRGQQGRGQPQPVGQALAAASVVATVVVDGAVDGW
jgi:hypothetical protein